MLQDETFIIGTGFAANCEYTLDLRRWWNKNCSTRWPIDMQMRIISAVCYIYQRLIEGSTRLFSIYAMDFKDFRSLRNPYYGFCGYCSHLYRETNRQIFMGNMYKYNCCDRQRNLALVCSKRSRRVLIFFLQLFFLVGNK